MKRAGKMIAAALEDSERCPLLLEQTAGHKGLLGRDFDQTAELIELAGGGKRLGLCLDSCHLFVQGYDITDAEHLSAVARRSRREGRPGAAARLHVNDAAAPLGSCRDRHANIGKGEMGKQGLAAFLSEPRFEGLPATLETPGPDKKGPDRKEVQAAKRLRKAGLKASAKGLERRNEMAMIDHAGVEVESFERSREFYAAALAPLGIEPLAEMEGAAVRARPTPTASSRASRCFWIAGPGAPGGERRPLRLLRPLARAGRRLPRRGSRRRREGERRARPTADLPTRTTTARLSRPRRQQRRGRLPQPRYLMWTPGDRAGDDQALDLRGALEDRVDLRVAVHALDRELAGVAVAAEDLDRPLGRPDGDLAGLQLRHRALGVLEGLAGCGPSRRRARRAGGRRRSPSSCRRG